MQIKKQKQKKNRKIKNKIEIKQNLDIRILLMKKQYPVRNNQKILQNKM